MSGFLTGKLCSAAASKLTLPEKTAEGGVGTDTLSIEERDTACC